MLNPSIFKYPGYDLFPLEWLPNGNCIVDQENKTVQLSLQDYYTYIISTSKTMEIGVDTAIAIALYKIDEWLNRKIEEKTKG